MIRRVTGRIAIAGMSVSALAFVARMGQEGWADKAVIPVKDNVPTVGPGLTKRADGSPVRLGDTIKPLEGVQRSLAHTQKDEQGVQARVPVPLSQAEYDLMVDFSYQYGTAALCKSSIASEADAGRYQQCWEAYLKYQFVPGGIAHWPAASAAASGLVARAVTKPAWLLNEPAHFAPCCRPGLRSDRRRWRRQVGCEPLPSRGRCAKGG